MIRELPQAGSLVVGLVLIGLGLKLDLLLVEVVLAGAHLVAVQLALLHEVAARQSVGGHGLTHGGVGIVIIHDVATTYAPNGSISVTATGGTGALEYAIYSLDLEASGKLTINGITCGNQYTMNPDFKPGGAAFFDSEGAEKPQELENRIFLNAVLGKGELCVLPEQAACVTRILEAIYTSAKTGQPVYFD